MAKGLARDRKTMYAIPIKCSKCDASGGTLLKVDDHYEHQNKADCRIMQMRKEVQHG